MNDVGGAVIGTEHNKFLGQFAYCSSFACVCGVGQCDNNVAANREILGGGRAWFRLFHELVGVGAGVCVAEGTLDQCSSGFAALCMLKELGGGERRIRFLKVTPLAQYDQSYICSQRCNELN